MKKALYTKYRPLTFEEVVGQDNSVKILKRSIETDQVNHAYLFYGIRGTGKTTLARIFAKAINCNEETKPCNKCSSCEEINNSSMIDVIELDAASNNGVDEIRDLTEKANYASTNSKYKVYIIDEVHMLSKAAFNALLKTLEEPPKNTIFLLATTEINRIPDTIISRTIVLNLNLVSKDLIKKNLKNILDSEQISYDEESLDIISTVSSGSVRDSISTLQTLILHSETVTSENTFKALGLINSTLIEEKLMGDLSSLANEINEEINGRKLLLVIVDILIKKVSEGHDFKELLSKMTDGLINIKDPVLMNSYIKSVLLTSEKRTIEKTIELESDAITSQDIISKQIDDGTQEAQILFEDVNKPTQEPTVETPVVEEQVVEEQVVEGPVIEEEQKTIVEESVKNEEVIEQEEVESPAYELNADDYVYTMINTSQIDTENIKAKWIKLQTHNFEGEQQILSDILSGMKPLISSETTTIVGAPDEYHYKKIKEKVNSPEIRDVIKTTFGKEIVFLPVTSEKWSKLMLLAKKIKDEGKTVESNIDMNTFYSGKLPKEQQIESDLFGDKINYE